MRELSEERRHFYRNVMETCKAEYEAIDNEIERLVEETRKRVRELQRDLEAALMVYTGACRRLGLNCETELKEKVELED